MKQLRAIDNNSSLDQIKSEFNSLFKNKIAISHIRFSLFLIIVSWLLFVLFYRILPPEIPLFFSKPIGREQLISKEKLAIIPVSLTLFFVFNIRFASQTLEKDKLLGSIFLISQTAFSIFGLFILIRLILLLC